MSNFLTRVSNNCQRYGDRIAFLDDTRSISFNDLWTESGKVCSWIKAQGLGAEDFCLIVLPKSVSSMVSILGVLRSGCAFCNLDSSYPPERIAFIRNELQPKCILDERTFAQVQSEQEPYDGYIEPDPHDAAFVVYTSGSTGTPKGVLHEMGNVDLCLTLYPEQADYEELHTCFTAPLYAVASILLAINCMCVARTTHIVSDMMLRDILGLHKFLVENKIVDTFLPPSFVRLYPHPSPYLRDVLMGGEHADGIYYEGGTPKLLNYYSMTEAGFPLLVMPVDHKYERTPVGMPVVPGIDLHLEDEDGNRIEGAGEGEICFTNQYVRGYINPASAPEGVFCDGIVHTGDIAQRDENGIYTIVGRADDMFKINGNRIEPSEIETACRKALGLSWCAAKGFEDEGIVALFYTDETVVDEAAARTQLESVLPYYMIPTYFVHIDTAPVSSTGKVVRSALQLPTAVQTAAYVAPRNEIEQKLTDAMAEVLGLERVGIKDDFFQIGGNSIRAMEVLEKVDIEGLNMGVLYKGRTIEKAYELYAVEARTHMSDEEKEALGRGMRIPLDYQQRRIWYMLNNGTHDFITAYRLSPLVSIKRLQKTLNEYATLNSTFSLIIEDDSGEAVQVYSVQTPQFEIETMTEEEVKQLRKTFIRPFEYGEPLIRIRLIRTKLHRYLFFQMSHLSSDGAGMRQFVEDVATLYQGGQIRPTYYFAFALDNTAVAPEEKMQEAQEYFETKLEPTHRMRNLVKDQAGGFGQGIASEFSLPLKKIEKLVSKYDATNAAFIHLMTLLTIETYNKKPSLVLSFVENRSPHENAAGMQMATEPIGITARTGSLADLFEDMCEQQYNMIRYTYYGYPLFHPADDDYAYFFVSYILDWFSQDEGAFSFGKQLELENQHVEKADVRPILYLRAWHAKGNMVFQFQYDKRYLTAEHAEDFVALMKHTGSELLEGRLPAQAQS